jgi:hypothetical protein
MAGQHLLEQQRQMSRVQDRDPVEGQALRLRLTWTMSTTLSLALGKKRRIKHRNTRPANNNTTMEALAAAVTTMTINDDLNLRG